MTTSIAVRNDLAERNGVTLGCHATTGSWPEPRRHVGGGQRLLSEARQVDPTFRVFLAGDGVHRFGTAEADFNFQECLSKLGWLLGK